MTYYAIAQFDSKEEAETFAFAQKDTQIEVVKKTVQDNEQIYTEIDVALDKLAQTTESVCVRLQNLQRMHQKTD